MEFILLIGLALAPGAFIGFFVWFKDHYEREPFKKLFICFLLGIISAVPAVLLSILLNKLFAVNFNSLLSVAIYAFITVAFAEEVAKFLFLKLYAFKQKEFNEPFDGIVYGVSISLGFAGIENILYVIEGGTQVGLLRMFTAVPAHASFGIMMGYYFGLAWQHKKKSLHYQTKGLLIAILLHGLYDFFLMQKNYPTFWILSFVGLAISIWLCFKAMKIHNKNSPFIK